MNIAGQVFTYRDSPNPIKERSFVFLHRITLKMLLHLLSLQQTTHIKYLTLRYVFPIIFTISTLEATACSPFIDILTMIFCPRRHLYATDNDYFPPVTSLTALTATLLTSDQSSETQGLGDTVKQREQELQALELYLL